jgi:hypothetical protein
MGQFSVLSALYVVFNMISAVGIVFANKAVFAIYKFPYPVLLTFVHIAFTALGMQIMAFVRLYPQPELYFCFLGRECKFYDF